MGKKWLFLVVLLVILLNSFSTIAYEFEDKQEFVIFLEELDEQGIDFRYNSKTSLEIMDYAKEYEVDLNYYKNIKLYNSIFSSFSWFLTGFATGGIPPTISLNKEEYVPGEKVIVEITNSNQILSDTIDLILKEKIVASMPKPNFGEVTLGFTMPNLPSGAHDLTIVGTNVKEKIEIKNVEIKKDPLLALDTNEIYVGESINIKGVNFPVFEIMPEDSLKIFAGDTLIAVVSYPVNGVFEANAEINLKPGQYLIFVKDYETAFAKLNVVQPYIEPIIKISKNVFLPNEMMELLGYNFEKVEEVLLFGNDYSEKINVIIENGGFHKLTNAPSEQGEYIIMSKASPSILVPFKVVEEEPVQGIYTKDNSVERGQDIVLLGYGFAEGQKIVLMREGETLQRIVASCDSWGKFEKSLVTETYYVGKHKVYLQDNPEVATYFNIEKEKPLPEIIFNNPIYAAEDFAVKGEHFYDYEIVSLYVDNDKLGNVDIVNNEFEFKVANNLNEGGYKLSVKDLSNQILTIEALNIVKKNNPVIKVVTENIYVSGIFQIKGFYFNEDVEIFINNQFVGKAEIDKSGALTKEIDLSNLKLISGSYKLSLRYFGEEEIVAFVVIKVQEKVPDPNLRIVEKEVYKDSLIHINGDNFYQEMIKLYVDDVYSFDVEISENNAFEVELDLGIAGLDVGSYKLYCENPISATALNILPGESEPTIKLDKQEYISGEIIQVVGHNFENGDGLIIVDGTQSYSVVVIDNSFELEINSMDFYEGYHKLSMQGLEVVSSFFITKLSQTQPVLIIKPSEITLGQDFYIQGLNFNSAAESIVLLLDEEIQYTVYPEQGNFNFKLNSDKFGLGFHNIRLARYGIEEVFAIVKESKPTLDVNSTLYVGQVLNIHGQNFEDGQGKIFIDEVFVGGVFIKDGEFKASIETSSFDEGYHTLNVKESSASFNLEKEIIPKPEIRLSHSIVSAGFLMGIRGTNFPKLTSSDISANPSLSILVDKELVLRIPYPTDGFFDATYMISNREHGVHIISVEGHSTATANFISESMSSTELSMVVFDDKVIPGDAINGVINGMGVGIITELDILFNFQPSGKIKSTGLGSAPFSIIVPELPADVYPMGIAGYGSALAHVEILEMPKEQESKAYSPKQVEEITKEVQYIVSGIQETQIADLEVEEFNFADVQNRILGDFVKSLVRETCVPNCEHRCRQPNGCGGYCPSNDIGEPNKCGNPSLEINVVQKATQKVSEPISNLLMDKILFITN